MLSGPGIGVALFLMLSYISMPAKAEWTGRVYYIKEKKLDILHVFPRSLTCEIECSSAPIKRV